jgi:hypothetical protein
MFNNAFNALSQETKRRLKQLDNESRQNAIAFVVGYRGDGNPIVRVNGSPAASALGLGARNLRVGEGVSFYRPDEGAPGYVDSL